MLLISNMSGEMYELTALSFIMIFVRTKLGNPGQTYFLKIAVLYPFDK